MDNLIPIAVIVFGLALAGIECWKAISLQRIADSLEDCESYEESYVLTDYGRRLVEALASQEQEQEREQKEGDHAV